MIEHRLADDDELPPPPWARAPQPRARRRRDPLTQEAIVEAALAVLDADGLERLTMRHVARTLNTTATALYWHVGSKDGLLDLIFDRVIGEQHVPAPDPDRWQAQLKEVARTMRATLRRHRDIVRLSIGRIPLGPAALRYADRVLAILRAGGLSPELALAGHHLLMSVVIGFAIDETGEGGQPPADRPPEQTAAEAIRDYYASLPRDRFPHLAEVAAHADITSPNADERFELLLDVFVDGLAKRAPAR